MTAGGGEGHSVSPKTRTGSHAKANLITSSHMIEAYQPDVLESNTTTAFTQPTL